MYTKHLIDYIINNYSATYKRRQHDYSAAIILSMNNRVARAICPFLKITPTF